MSKKYNIENGKIVPTESENAQILLFANPSIEEQKFLTETLKVDEHTLASALDPEELSRLEFEPDHAAVIIKRPKNYSGKDQLEFKVASIGLFLFEEKLVIVVSEEISLFIGKRFVKVNDLNDVCLKIMYNSVTHYVEHLRVINLISDEIEDKMTESLDNTYLLNLFSLEKSLVYYANAISANGFVFEKLRNFSARIGLSEYNREMLDDIVVENAQCQKQADIYSNVLASLMDARASIVSNNLNLLMKKLNNVTIWIMVPTFVVSAFSMNVEIPMQFHPNAFWMVMGLAILSVWLIITYWRYKNW